MAVTFSLMPSSFGTHHVGLVSTFLCLYVQIIVGCSSPEREREGLLLFSFNPLFFFWHSNYNNVEDESEVVALCHVFRQNNVSPMKDKGENA